MKKSIYLVALSFSLTASAVMAGPISIDFSDFAPGSILTETQGVSFSLEGGPIVGGDPTISSGGLLTNSATGGGYPTANILQFTFDGTASDVSFVFHNAGTGYTGGRGDSFFEAFDTSGSLVDAGSLNGASYELFSVNGSDIKTLQFNNNTNGTESWWFGVSSLNATTVAVAVPEPGSLALMAFGLTGLAVLRRRKTSS